MKKIFFLFIIFFTAFTLNAQKKFDEKTGDEILKLLPDKMKDKNNGKDKDAKKEKDKVKDAKGFLGVIIHRDYGEDDQSIRVEIINNSPSLISVNAFLNNPVNNPDLYAVTVIDGYPALVQTLTNENSTIDYELLLPMDATLLTVRCKGYNREEVIAFANNIPVAKIAKKVAK